MNFNKALSFGEKYQKELVNILKPINFKMMEGYFKDYDLIIDDVLPIYYEVKADKYANHFQQFCIEYECNKKPSGICTTTADYYAYFVIKPNNLYDLYIIPVIDIKEIINKRKYAGCKEGGDRKASKFYVIDFILLNQYKYTL